MKKKPSNGKIHFRINFQQEWAAFKKALYVAAVVFLAASVVVLYALWLKNYYDLHPETTRAMAARYVEELPLDGILIWNEEMVAAPRDGAVSYPSLSPRRVAKGDVVARVENVEVRAAAPGYFSPAMDGQEGRWEYSKLWLSENFPVVMDAGPVKKGTRVRKGDPVGKLAPQPQDLLCIAYLDLTPGLSRDVRQEFINVKTEPNGKTRQAEVRASVSRGQKLKLCVALPFFQPHLLLRRNFSCGVPTEDLQGISVPDTAVLHKEGKLGVFVVRGNRSWFVEVKGFPVDGDNFFITEGVSAGNIVILHAGKAKEGTVII